MEPSPYRVSPLRLSVAWPDTVEPARLVPMFTGIITDVGSVVAVDRRGDTLFTIATGFDMETVDIGASIACSGCCLTVIAKASGRFTVQASAETLSKTNLGAWAEGSEINLERALRLGDELGGHIVSGHVDGLAEV